MIELQDDSLAQKFSVSLSLVRSEIEHALNNAFSELQAYAEAGLEDRLRSFLEEVRQLRGTFKMLNFRAGERLCEEVTETIRRQLHDEVPAELLESCNKALITLSRYIDIILSGQPIAPSLLIPSINDLRIQRGSKKLPEGYFFSVNLRPKINAPKVHSPVLNNVPFRSLRRMVQVAILGVIGHKREESLNILLKAVSRVELVSRGTVSWSFWNLVMAAVQALQQPEFELTDQRIAMLGYIDRQIKKLNDTNGQGFSEKLPDWVIKEFLYIVALSDSSTDLIEDIKKTYMVLDHLSERQLIKARRILDGLDKEVILSLAREMSEEIQVLKDLIDVKRLGSDSDSLDELITHLKRLSSTLVMVDMTEIASDIDGLVDELKTGEVDINILAEHIVSLELDVRALTLNSRLHGDFSVDPIVLKEAKISLVSESVANLIMVKHTAIAYIETNDESKISAIAKGLREIAGIAAFMNKKELHAVLLELETFVIGQLAKPDVLEQPRLLDTFADAVTAIEYYLDVLGSSAIMAEEALSMARTSAKTLLNIGG